MNKGADGRYQFDVGPEHVGARLLDIVSGALYGNVLDILREYIQNAVDAGAERVRIILGNNEVLIRDNGRGLNPQGLDNARKVAVSGKRGDDVGFRGIGVYSSFTSCDGLELLTRPTGELNVYALRLDFAGMRDEEDRRAAEDPPASLPLQEALSIFTEIADYTGPIPLDGGGPFTLVRLRNPDSHLVDALEKTDALTDYLRAAVPLKFPPGHPHADHVMKELRAHGVERRGIDIDLTPRGKDPNAPEASQPFYLSGFDQLLPPVVHELHSGKHKLGVIWYAVHQEPSVLPRGERGGIQIRLKGFGIGDVSLARRVWGNAGSGVLYRHFIGELHVVDPRLRPSAERSNFEDSPARRELMDRLEKDIFGQLGSWIQNRQTVLAAIRRSNEITAENQTKLDQLSKTYGSTEQLSATDILDESARNILESSKKDEKSGGTTHTSGPEDGGGGDGDGSGDTGSGGKDKGGGDSDGGSDDQKKDKGDSGSGGSNDKKGPVPTLAKMLLDLPLRWPNGTKPVFDALDDAVRQLPGDQPNQFRGWVRERLAKVTFVSRKRR
jgi:hypothetical protein